MGATSPPHLLQLTRRLWIIFLFLLPLDDNTTTVNLFCLNTDTTSDMYIYETNPVAVCLVLKKNKQPLLFVCLVLKKSLLLLFYLKKKREEK